MVSDLAQRAVRVSNSRTSLSIMPRLLALALAFFIVTSAGNAAANNRAGAAILFSNDKGGLSERERVEIFKSLGLSVSPDGNGLVDQVCGQPVMSEVRFLDMNSDKVKEVLVTYGNACMSGMDGSSVVLFIKDPSGRYRSNLGFPASSAEPLSTKNHGYPDLLIGGPGFCFPIWRWNGAEYVHLRDEPQSPGGCDHR